MGLSWGLGGQTCYVDELVGGGGVGCSFGSNVFPGGGGGVGALLQDLVVVLAGLGSEFCTLFFFVDYSTLNAVNKNTFMILHMVYNITLFVVC